jgi:glyoxylate/hydroxypyruvate reductase
MVEEDLLDALETGQLAGAFLDVFAQEPLPADHPFWTHPQIVVTPHMAGELLPSTAVLSIAQGIRDHEAGRALSHVYDKDRGY